MGLPCTIAHNSKCTLRTIHISSIIRSAKLSTLCYIPQKSIHVIYQVNIPLYNCLIYFLIWYSLMSNFIHSDIDSEKDPTCFAVANYKKKDLVKNSFGVKPF